MDAILIRKLGMKVVQKMILAVVQVINQKIKSQRQPRILQIVLRMIKRKLNNQNQKAKRKKLILHHQTKTLQKKNRRKSLFNKKLKLSHQMIQILRLTSQS